MIFTETELPGAFLIGLAPHSDERGFFARAFCRQEFEKHGLVPLVAQCNVSYNVKRGTIRGMHYQVAPALESKLVRCVRGAVLDVIVDLRVGSPTYLRHVAVELTAGNHLALYLPPMCAHGFQTLVDDTEVLYQVGEFYTPECERGARYDDPALGIRWPLPVTVISDKDRRWPPVEAALAREGAPNDHR